MALKRTSEIITISTGIKQAVVNAFEVAQVDLQLNPLDQEVFVVLAAKIDFLSDFPFVGTFTPGTHNGQAEIAITTTRPTTMPRISDSNCVAYSSVQTKAGVSATNELTAFAVLEQNAADTPDSNLDYLAIIATSDMFLSVDSLFSVANTEGAVRVYGYRARADAAQYAALVQSEVLSA